MTKLSLFLYAADALDSISNFLVGFGIIAAIIFVIFGIATLISWVVKGSSDDEEGAQWFRAHTKRTLIIPVIAMFFFFGASAMIPEKQTMYMIAGVEMANEFRQTDTAHELSSEMKGVLHDITGIIHGYAVKHGAKDTQEAK